MRRSDRVIIGGLLFFAALAAMNAVYAIAQQAQAPPTATETQVQLLELSRRSVEQSCAQAIASLQKQLSDKDAELAKLKTPHKEEKK
jgi:hypothetical protein